MNKYILLLIISLGFFANSCQRIEVKTHEFAFPNQSWNAFKKVHFETRIKNKEIPRSLQLEVKLTDKFQQQSFDFSLSQTNDEGESRYSNYSIPVKGSKGDFINEIDEKGFYTYKLIMFKKAYFNSDSLYHFTFESTMNKYDVQGVESLKLTIKSI